MKKLYLLLALSCLFACQSNQKNEEIAQQQVQKVKINIEAASKLIKLPLKCSTQEYPNKLGQVIGDSTDLKTPRQLHPAFYGCFDWHSSVHGHWSMVELLKLYPNLKASDSIKQVLKSHLSQKNIEQELAYFKREINNGYERMYGWAWLFKLSQALYEWEDPIASELYENLMPLIEELKLKFEGFIPKLIYPIRVGEHTNTAFALNMMFDYAKSLNDKAFLNDIKSAAIRYYNDDKRCPLNWEPSGYDFLSPCLEEAVLMQKVLKQNAFESWIKDFLPQLKSKDFELEVAKVSDRSDGKLVHLDGLNFSRAWNLYKLSKSKQFTNLRPIAKKHFNAAYPNLIGDSYEGGHWLASFALYAYLAQ